MPKKYDAIIIGGGIGGLTIGSLLSKKKKVLILEKNSKPGGYCASFKKGDFQFESAIQTINGLKRGSVIRNIFESTGALKGIDLIKPKTLYRTIFPHHDITVPQGDISKYKKMLLTLFPEEKNSLIDLFDVMKSIYEEMNRFYEEKSLKRSPFLLRYYKKSFADLLNEFVKDKKLISILSQYWMYQGLPIAQLSSIIFSYILYDYTANGSYLPEGGMGRVLENLIFAIKNNCGDIKRNSEASKLHLDSHNRISHLELVNGEKIIGDIFISSSDVLRTLKMLRSESNNIIEEFSKSIDSNNISISAFKVYLGLNVGIKTLGVSDYEIFINPDYDIDKMYQASLSNNYKNSPISIAIYSNLANSFSEEGRSVISMNMLSGYDFWRTLSKRDYKRNKLEVSDFIISKCESVLPGIKKHIRTKIVATPLTMERYTGNCKGAAYGWHKRNISEEIRFMNRTPVSNLFLLSQWTKMGGGVAGILASADRLYDFLNSKDK